LVVVVERGVNFTGKNIHWHTGVVSWEHEDYLIISDASRLEVLIDNKDINCMPVVEKEFTG